jgi:TRAP transporter TAXI family solute receptor
MSRTQKPPIRDPFARFRFQITQMSVLGVFVLVSVIMLLVAANPLFDRDMVFSVGTESGAYNQYALQYQESLAEEGIEVRILNGAGSIETMQHLIDGTADVGFVQGGTSDDFQEYGLESLGSMFVEPVWVFYRGSRIKDDLFDLENMRIAIGERGSGTQPVALQMLYDSGITPQNATFITADINTVVLGMQAGTMDAAFFVASPEAGFIRDLMEDSNIRLMNLRQAQALAARHPSHIVVTIPEGMISIPRDLPPRDVETVAVTANLVVRQTIHPDLVFLLLDSAMQIHGGKTGLPVTYEFPQPLLLEFPLNPSAQEFYNNTRPFSDSRLPVLLVGPLNRLLGVVVVLFLVWTAYSAITPLVSFFIELQTTRWYGYMAQIERTLDSMTIAEIDDHLKQLDTLDDRLVQTRVPFMFQETVYSVRGACEDTVTTLKERREALLKMHSQQLHNDDPHAEID